MSSKKAPSKTAKVEAKKAPAKKAEVKPAKKTAPAGAAKKAAAKPAKVEKVAPKAKAAAKPAAKSAKVEKAAPEAKASKVKAAAKPAAKPAKVEKAAPEAKASKAKAVAKPAAKPAKVEKAAPEAKASKAKAAAKPAAKPAKVEKAAPEAKASKSKAAAKPAKVETKAKDVKAEVKAETVKPEKAKAEKVKEPKDKKAAVEAKDDVKVGVPEVAETSAKGKKGKAAEEVKQGPDYAVLLENVKKLSKTVMFVEIDEQEDRSNKKKMSSEMKNLEMKPTSALRHKASLAEETQEELTERILKELEEQNMAFEREAASQMCTRCNRNLVSPEFWVDKHLGYCEECAMILKLGQSKEARKVEYQLGGMGDSLDEEDDEILGPDADDLKEAEEDLADMDD